jgi:hypothetical protein
VQRGQSAGLLYWIESPIATNCHRSARLGAGDGVAGDELLSGEWAGDVTDTEVKGSEPEGVAADEQPASRATTAPMRSACRIISLPPMNWRVADDRRPSRYRAWPVTPSIGCLFPSGTGEHP